MSDAVLRRVASTGLGTTARPSVGPLPDERWRELLSDVQRARLAGFLAAAVRDGDLEVTDPQRAAVDASHLSAMETALRLELQLLDLVELLGAAEIEHRVLKGSAVAHLDYPHPELRAFGDIDVLIPPRQLPLAISALEREGWRRELPERRAGFDGRFAKEVCLTRPGSFESDLHRTLVPGAFGFRIALAELWDEGDVLVLAGRQLRALPRTMRFIHACYTAMLSDPVPKLLALRDVAEIGRSPELDLGEVGRIAHRWGGQVVVTHAVRTCRSALGEVLPAEVTSWAEALPSGWGQEVLSRTYRAHGGSNTATLLGGAVAIPGVARAAYLRALLLPGAEYRRARRASHRPNEWRRGSREMLGRRGRPASPAPAGDRPVKARSSLTRR